MDTSDEAENTIQMSSRRTAIRNINIPSNTNQYDSLIEDALNQNSTPRQQLIAESTKNHSLNAPITSMMQSHHQIPSNNQFNQNISSLTMQSSDSVQNQQSLIGCFNSVDEIDITNFLEGNNLVTILSDDQQNPSNEPKETLTLPGLTELNAFLKENNAATKRELNFRFLVWFS